MINAKQSELLNLIADIQTMREEEADFKADVSNQEHLLEITKEDLAELTNIIKDKIEQINELIADLTAIEEYIEEYNEEIPPCSRF